MCRLIDITINIFFLINWKNYFDRSILDISMTVLQYTQISTINMYKFLKIRHDILIQCHWNYMEMEKYKYML